MDARDFQFPLEPLVVYLFNPFPEPVFAAVLENFGSQLWRIHGQFIVAYRYLELERIAHGSQLADESRRNGTMGDLSDQMKRWALV